jgi:hypothetical protein
VSGSRGPLRRRMGRAPGTRGRKPGRPGFRGCRDPGRSPAARSSRPRGRRAAGRRMSRGGCAIAAPSARARWRRAMKSTAGRPPGTPGPRSRGTGAHDQLEWVLTVPWSHRPRSRGTRRPASQRPPPGGPQPRVLPGETSGISGPTRSPRHPFRPAGTVFSAASRRASRRQRAPRAGRTSRELTPANRAAIRADDIRITPPRTRGRTNRSACPFNRWRAMPQPSSPLGTSSMPVPRRKPDPVRAFRAEPGDGPARPGSSPDSAGTARVSPSIPVRKSSCGSPPAGSPGTPSPARPGRTSGCRGPRRPDRPCQSTRIGIRTRRDPAVARHDCGVGRPARRRGGQSAGIGTRFRRDRKCRHAPGQHRAAPATLSAPVAGLPPRGASARHRRPSSPAACSVPRSAPARPSCAAAVSGGLRFP